MGQSDEDDMEIDSFSDVGVSKLSDDSGIEDMNEDGCPLNNSNKGVTGNAESPEVTACTSDFTASVRDLNYVDAMDKKEEMPLSCIYPLSLNDMQQSLGRQQDVKGPNSISGICGLNNLGNTCFINAGLQCLFKTPLATSKPLDTATFFGEEESDTLQALVTFEDRFADLCKRVLSGSYLSIWPSDLHKALGSIHSPFTNHKQHDCQEFVLFVLNALHEVCSRRHSNQHNEADSFPKREEKTLPQSVQAVDEDCKRMRIEFMESEDADPGVECDESLSSGEKAWRTYTKENNSVVVDKFHGQFKSTVTCEKCQHVSVMHEPFVCISTPIPYAMERQIVVTWIPSPKHEHLAGKISARRYLVTIKEHNQVKDIRSALIKKLYETEDTEMRFDELVLAEVKNSTVVRTLDDRMQTQYMDEENTKLYAVEVFSVFERALDIRAKNVLIDKLTKEDLSHLRETGSPTLLEQVEAHPCHQAKDKGSRLLREKTETLTCRRIVSKTISLEDNIGPLYCSECGLSLPPDQSRLSDCSCKKALNPQEGGTDKATMSGWHSCSICLEDIFDNELMIHPKCGGMLCKGCLDSTNTFHSNKSFPCPVCRSVVATSDYKQFITSDPTKVVSRNITVPVLFRCECDTGLPTPRGRQFKTFGHPTFLVVPSQVNSSLIYQKVEIVLRQYGPVPSFNLLLTDAQGQSCSRCDLMDRCTGCTLDSDSVFTLKPGDHFAVHLQSISNHFLNQMNLTVDDQSLAKQRDSNVIQLEECFQAFCESESLGEENPWFCPECKVNQVATKVMSISRFPDIAIIHLKRFYFEGLRSCKVISPVAFPVESLNLESFSSSENVGKEDFVYDLVSCVCHTGDLSTGHYTSYARKEETGQWYYFNDEAFSEKMPSELDYEKVYLLFYQRRSSGKESPRVSGT